MTSALVSLSGGMDSTTILAMALKTMKKVEAVGFNYGAKHNKWENEAAVKIARHYNILYKVIDLSHFMSEFKSDLLLSGGDIPEGHYKIENMQSTVVPARNLIFASILAGIAASRSINSIWLGVHVGYNFSYPDCCPPFISSLRTTIQEALGDNQFEVVAPLLHGNKGDAITKAVELAIPFHLTRTCYKDQSIACGRCGTCQDRLKAFKFIGKEDPIEYEFRGILPK